MRGYECYKYHLINKELVKNSNTACWAGLDKSEYLGEDIYIDEYIEPEITEEYFKFKGQGSKYKNMLVCATVRLLWENIGSITPAISMHDVFFEKLQNGKSKYRNKLKRFCDFYSKIDVGEKDSYFNEGHSWKPSKTIIKSTLEFKKYNGGSVNNFFYK